MKNNIEQGRGQEDPLNIKEEFETFVGEVIKQDLTPKMRVMLEATFFAGAILTHEHWHATLSTEYDTKEDAARAINGVIVDVNEQLEEHLVRMMRDGNKIKNN